ncbi:tyrosine-type recombinase/integrase [Lactococcus piscium]|uniref:Prophage L54a n=1 Tax=Pseudolactococcus piscium MKFS47 TaxID=297352 RepID=A0A0D6DZF5_9LACT|nr:site-specific integrase [Lactococcus piscium]CEN29374.1 Prophage L54a [Lactococcus piscium MKFS47]
MWVAQKKNGKYIIRERYTDPYTGKTKIASLVIERNTSQAINKGSAVLSEKIKNLTKINYSYNKKTFGELYEEWFRYYKIQNKRTSWIKVPFMVDKHILPVITKEMLIDRVDAPLIMKIVDTMYTFGTYSLNYTKQTRTTLSAIFSFAVDKEYLETNPVAKTKVMPKREIERQQRKKLNDKYLEKAELHLLLEALYANPRCQLHAMIAEFLALTGLRYGELQAIQWKNFTGKSISIEGTLDYTLSRMQDAVKTSTKNESSERVVELPQKAINILLEIENINTMKYGITPEDYIFISNQKTPLTIHAFNSIIKRVAKNAGISKNVTSHIFRHTHVSMLSESNIPLKAIMERVGHSDANTTLQIYNHVTKKSKAQITNALDNIF